MDYDNYCSSCTYMHDNIHNGKYWCEMKTDWKKACDPKCYNWVKKGGRSTYACEDMYKNSYYSPYYITTIVCKMLGLPDDCHQLEMIAKLKEEMIKTHKGRVLVAIYNVIGPKIAQKLLEDQEYGKTLADYSLKHGINETAKAVEKEDYGSAIKIYSQMTRDLARCYGIGQKIAVTKLVDPVSFGKRRFTRKKEITNC